ncbi:LemA family protein [Candidatus Trichorickettsia mobilis]|uniref:LemA family protein n=1 Tax=Candidatus Trichorickettsia mobilis TaxID=1346319 RepID=A0ABZ0UV57_9RICK|nr:LemA family protein [Candidatus Trichorickettsia mobilis]WPY00972.1 LemA family protein [Candidatus Trichorickettsia mobilis]
MNKVTLAVIASVIILILSAIGSYNSLISHDEAVKREWGNLESTLQRRLDLIPNLVQTVKAYSTYESETLQKVVEARANATAVKIDASSLDNPEALQKYQQAQNQLSGSLTKLLAIAENYPDLKASETYRDLLAQLEGTENRINVARQNYNNEVKEYNYALRQFPGSLINKSFLNLTTKDSFAAEAEARTVPKVNFGK